MSWDLPDQQFDHPGRAPLGERTAQRRREVTFLLLAAAFLTSCTFMVAAGTGAVVDLSFDLDALEVTMPAIVPLGALVFPLSFLAIQLVSELHGRGHAAALLWIGLAFVALPVVVGSLAAGAAGEGASLLACCVVAHVLGGQVFRELRRALRGRMIWVPAAAASLVGQLAGWVVFAVFVNLSAGRLTTDTSSDAIFAMIGSDGLTGYSYAAACAIVLALALQVLAGPLARLLRVPMGRNLRRRRERRPSRAPASEPAFVRQERTVELTGEESFVVASRPFSADEAAFFDRGEQLETSDIEIVPSTAARE